MSRIYFHSEGDEAEVWGPERAYAGLMCADALVTALGVRHSFDSELNPSPIRKLLPEDSYLHRMHGPEFERSLETWLHVSSREMLKTRDGEGVTPFVAAVDTAIVMGSDSIRLLARLHGQCEIHCYVEGPNRAWLANIIEEGRKMAILRADMGWESVIALLRASAAGPVVTSYSVCEQFPNRHAAGWESQDDSDTDRWYDLPSAERWALAMEGLRSGRTFAGLALTPDNWVNYRIAPGCNGFELREYADELAGTKIGIT